MQKLEKYDSLLKKKSNTQKIIELYICKDKKI